MVFKKIIIFTHQPPLMIWVFKLSVPSKRSRMWFKQELRMIVLIVFLLFSWSKPKLKGERHNFSPLLSFSTSPFRCHSLRLEGLRFLFQAMQYVLLNHVSNCDFFFPRGVSSHLISFRDYKRLQKISASLTSLVSASLASHIFNSVDYICWALIQNRLIRLSLRLIYLFFHWVPLVRHPTSQEWLLENVL